MLELRPNCEHCARRLPPDSEEAMICSFECTFCQACVEQVLLNVCPNCGGGFQARPVRPANAWRPGLSVAGHPPLENKVYKPVIPDEHAEFAAPIKNIPPARR